MWLNVFEIIQQARDESGTTIGEISDAKCLWYVNVDYPKILNKIYFMDKNVWYTTWKTDLIAWINTYSLLDPIDPTPTTPGVFGQQDIEKVKIRYDTTQQYYQECKIVDFDNFDRDLAYYETNQSKDAPFVIIADRQILIYPTPKSDMTDGIILEGTKKPYRLTLNGTLGTPWYWAASNDIVIPDQYHDIQVWALMPRLFKYRKLPNDVTFANQEYQRKEQEMMYQVAIKQTTPTTAIQNDLSYLN